MPLPLYQGLDAQLPASTSQPQRHWGLFNDRYFSAHAPGYEERSAQDKDTQNALRAWLKKLHRRDVGDKAQLAAKAERVRSMVSAMQGQARLMLCDGLFTTGLGNPHPLENGFTWHHTLGTPYLSGAAVKGLVRALMETAYEGQDREALLKRWFGTAKKGDVAEQAGQFIFLDAVPVAPCQLYVAIMTPHMGKWYEKGGKDPEKSSAQPGDWHSPVPVQYLAARQLQLQFAILPRTAQAHAELDDAWQALTAALEFLGAGAKTAQGFGVFHPDDKAEQALAQKVSGQMQAQALQEKMQAASPLDRHLLLLQTEMPKGLDKLNGGHQDLARAFEWLEAWIEQFVGLADVTPAHRSDASALIGQGFTPGKQWSGAQEKRLKAARKRVRGE